MRKEKPRIVGSRFYKIISAISEHNFQPVH